MSRRLLFVPLLLATGVVLAGDVREPGDKPPAVEAPPADDVPEADGVAGGAEAREEEEPTLTSTPGANPLGMSILGNQEAPKALVIVPWKSSEIGDSLGISTMLDDSRQPIDREVFLRELRYYEIRSHGTPWKGPSRFLVR